MEKINQIIDIYNTMSFKHIQEIADKYKYKKKKKYKICIIGITLLIIIIIIGIIYGF